MCTKLRVLFGARNLWLDIATRLAITRPLPLPPFCELSDLQVDEIAQVCLRHHRLTMNLSSSSPMYIQYRMIQLSPGLKIESFCFLPGARHALILCSTGDLQLWDLRSENDYDLGHAVPGHGSGRLMATYESGFRSAVFNFFTCGATERVIMFCIVGNFDK